MLQIADGDQKKVVGDLKPFSVKESKESHTAAAALRARLLRLPLTYASKKKKKQNFDLIKQAFPRPRKGRVKEGIRP